jgi:hypothetical protein
VLAAHAAPEEVRRPTMTETCAALFERSAPEMRSVLDEKRMAIYDLYRAELSKPGAAQTAGPTRPDFPANARIQ